MKIGDRVRNIRVECYSDKQIEIIGISGVLSNRYHIKYFDVFSVSGRRMTSWVSKDDIELDKQYYRELKINNILNE